MAQYEDLKMDPHSVDKYLLPKDEEIRIKLRQISEANPNKFQIPENTATIQESKTPQMWLDLKDAYDGSLVQGLAKTVGTAALGAFGLNKVGQGLAFLDKVTRANKYLNAGRTLLDAGLTVDGLFNLATENGVQKTIREAKAGNTWNAVKSGVGDALDLLGAGDLVGAGIKYSKPFSNLVKDFKFATNAVKDFKNAPIKIQIGQGVYNFSRIPIRFGLNVTGAREVFNPIAYTLMKLNKGQSNGLGIFNKDVMMPPEKLIPAYRQFMLADTSWEKLLPSGLVSETSERAKQVFDEAKSLKRYSDLPIYKLDFDIREGFPHKGYRGTYKKNGASFTSRPYDSSDQGIEPKINIGGHYVSSTKQPNGAFKIELKDTQHFSPMEYVNKWQNDTRQTLPIINGKRIRIPKNISKPVNSTKQFLLSLPVANLDFLGRDFNLYGSKIVTP